MATKVIMPQMGESIAEGTVVKWLKKVGERVERDEPLLEISTDKVDAEIPSPASGVLTEIVVTENQTVEVNAVLGWIDGEGAGQASGATTAETAEAPPASPPTPAPAPPVSAAITAAGAGPVRSSPVVQKLAAEHNVDLTKVRGTGQDGRISKKDILDYVAQRKAAPAPPPDASAAATPAAAPASAPMTFTGPSQVGPMTPIRRQIAEHMVASRRTSAHVSTVFEVEMTRVVELMARRGEEFERRHAFKLTYTPFFVRASVAAIREFPIINSSVDGTNIVYKRDLNIGIAVAMETGLIVPVVKNAGEKNFLEVARAVKDLA